MIKFINVLPNAQFNTFGTAAKNRIKKDLSECRVMSVTLISSDCGIFHFMRSYKEGPVAFSILSSDFDFIR